MTSFWQPLALSVELAAATTAVLLVVGLPLAYWLAFSRSRLRPLVHALVSLPLVLPPTVLGFYLLMLLGPAGPFGRWLESVLGLRLVFSFPGLVIGSVFYSLPFMVQPIETALAALPPSLAEAAYVLGKTRWETFWRVLLPNVRPAVLTAAVLSFAHTIGEFGVVLMIGGSIPGRTRVASIAIFAEVESMNYAMAHRHALILLAVTLPVLLALQIYRRRPVEVL
ncbi:MAG: molybdate ABC transporter permease subunit [Elusimicrobia bacterium]|nr:molybdate ABC transporter permease subunit [Elusimicrobiota bacterium]